jgi:tripartite-type tricarboxylate transporter receptor subunit TctC
MRELGFTDPLYDSNVWIGLLAPAATAQPIIDRLAKDVRAIVGSPDISKTFVDRGFEVMNTTPEQFGASYRAEFEVVTKRIRELQIEPQ